MFLSKGRSSALTISRRSTDRFGWQFWLQKGSFLQLRFFPVAVHACSCHPRFRSLTRTVSQIPLVASNPNIFPISTCMILRTCLSSPAVMVNSHFFTSMTPTYHQSLHCHEIMGSTKILPRQSNPHSEPHLVCQLPHARIVQTSGSDCRRRPHTPEALPSPRPV